MPSEITSWGVFVDEVHLIYKWGNADKGLKAFRECFAKLGELRSIVKWGTPILVLTATADQDSRAIIQKQLHFEDVIQVTISPNRKNIRFVLIKVSSLSYFVFYRLNLNTNVDEGLRTLLKNISKSCFRKALFSHSENI